MVDVVAGKGDAQVSIQMTEAAEEDRVPTDAPVVETLTHVYMILPEKAWPLAASFIAERVGPDTPMPIDPAKTSYLVAVNRISGEIEGFLSVNGIVIAQHFACVPGSGVSYSKFHDLIRAALPPGTVYYSDGADTDRGRAASARAGLSEVGRLWMGVTGVEDSDAVDGSNSGNHRSDR